MKNSKGFTLVEVLATLIVLGVVSTMVMPKIFDYINSSRDNIYVQDAKKMISLAQYNMGASSTDIEKPNDGEIVIFTLNYLAGNDFRNPPNGGSYMMDASFVAVTYSLAEDKYYFAGMLVEKIDDKGLNGVRLSTEESINNSKYKDLISGFSDDELRYVETPSNGSGTLISTKYITDQLGSIEPWSNLINKKAVVRAYHDKKAIEYIVEKNGNL